MKVGDLIRVATVLCNDKLEVCPCWFCTTGNPKVGTVLRLRDDVLPSPEYDVLFGKEIYTIFEGEAEVLNECR